VDARKGELVAKLRERREKLGRTLDELDARVTEIRQLPMRIRADVQRIGRLTAIVVGVTAVALASVLITRAVMRSRAPTRRR